MQYTEQSLRDAITLIVQIRTPAYDITPKTTEQALREDGALHHGAYFGQSKEEIEADSYDIVGDACQDIIEHGSIIYGNVVYP